MMYRCGYSYKDPNQERVLALRMKHSNFEALLRLACLASAPHKGGQSVIVQWDPERSPKIGKLKYRSIQIGMPRSVAQQWIDEWIESIEDVTEMARKLKKRLEQNPKVTNNDLIEAGLLPLERKYIVPEDIHEKLEMS